MTIRELRMKTGLSQGKFADLTGVPVRTVQQWEQGRSSPPEYLLHMIESRVLEKQCVPRHSYISGLRLKDPEVWPCFVEEPFMNCSRIHPLQQRKVAILLKDLSASGLVKNVFVFGSSVTNRCHIGSDIDIYAEMTEDVNPLTGKYDFAVDFWNNFRADDRLKEEIRRKGVEVYG